MTKSVFVTLAGHTNAGKSTLLNAIIGEKIASISAKPQTTRTRITGIKTVGETQMVFIDTPGLHKPTTKLSHQMLKVVQNVVADMDAVLFVQDCTRPLSGQEEQLLCSLKQAKTPVILVLNKIDLCKDKSQLMGTIAKLNLAYDFSATIPISAMEQDGIDRVEQEVLHLATPAPHYFSDVKFTAAINHHLFGFQKIHVLYISDYVLFQLWRNSAFSCQLFYRQFQYGCALYCTHLHWKRF